MAGILIGLGTSFYFLYTRHKDWTTPWARWIISGGLFVIGLLGLANGYSNHMFLFFWSLCIPLVYYATDRFFRFLSFKFYQRDLYLWLRYSDQINHRLTESNPHVKILDQVFSLTLLFLIIGLAGIGATIAPN